MGFFSRLRKRRAVPAPVEMPPPRAVVPALAAPPGTCSLVPLDTFRVEQVYGAESVVALYMKGKPIQVRYPEAVVLFRTFPTRFAPLDGIAEGAQTEAEG